MDTDNNVGHMTTEVSVLVNLRAAMTLKHKEVNILKVEECSNTDHTEYSRRRGGYSRKN